ncbi:MAG: SDR family oxidoreductase [Deltaproteobacteria bacterium]|jgi:3-oxoacyl-[acyl-carrier protein] reductase|nr:SDR family oxidoreductase [Deltaproteobacteria bacterium]
MEIKNKVALILGASKGIGLAIGRALAQNGAKIVLPFHTDWPEEAEKMQKEFAGLGGNHLAVKVDLREADQVKSLVENIQARFGALHILVNNIERGGMPVVHGSYDLEVNREQWDLEMDTTVKAKWLVVHNALPLMKNSGEGVIINISSIAGIVARSGPAGLIFNDGYAAANRAISSFTESWAREAAPAIRVNELMLGFFETRHGEGTRGWEILSESEKTSLCKHTLLQRTGKLEEAVKAVLFLIKDADFITGAVLRLDGGYVLGGERVPEIPDGILDS